ncbi:MAG: hypothetical protein M0002_03100 [Rhodospirillales bacterium]|nr:hypothetical protein [Rhodospirillales bacterium]
MLAAPALPDATQAEVAVRDQAIASARSVELAAAANKPLSPAVVAQVENLPGLPPTDPMLGVAP